MEEREMAEKMEKARLTIIDACTNGTLAVYRFEDTNRVL